MEGTRDWELKIRADEEDREDKEADGYQISQLYLSGAFLIFPPVLYLSNPQSLILNILFIGGSHLQLG